MHLKKHVFTKPSIFDNWKYRYIYIRVLLYQIKIKMNFEMKKKMFLNINCNASKFFKSGIWLWIQSTQSLDILKFVMKWYLYSRFVGIQFSVFDFLQYFGFRSSRHRTSVSSTQTTLIWRKVIAKVIEKLSLCPVFTNMPDFKQITVDWTAPTIQPFCGPPP